ncbi:MAG: GtrA family protein [Burkholderiales bacterium]
MMTLDSRFFIFALAGLGATIVHLGVFSVLVEAFGVTPVAASVPAFLSAMMCSYAANRTYTFAALGNSHLQLPKYAVVAVMGLSLNVLITFIVVDLLNLWYGIALAIVISIVPVITFLLNRGWTFDAAA